MRYSWPRRNATAGTGTRRGLALAGLMAACCCCAGCPVFQNTDVPGAVQRLREPVDGAEYFLYVPSRYDAEHAWPVVISCHGTTPWDTAERQILEWADLAESKRFIAVAPVLVGTRGDFVPSPEKQIALQERDEHTILAVLDHVKAGRNVAEDRVFLTGWSGGGYAVLFTGLRHPDVFRALAVRQGNFDARYVEPCLPYSDPYQPIYVLYGATDIFTKHYAKACLEWLHEHRLFAIEEETVGSHQRHPELAYQFFRRCLKQYPWIQPAAYRVSADDPLSVQFRVRCSPSAEAYLWRFGDGDYSREASPIHRYGEAGRYEVKLTVRTTNDRQCVRSLLVDVPTIRTAPAGVTPAPPADSGALRTAARRDPDE
jgi:dienelactone hydrolase